MFPGHRLLDLSVPLEHLAASEPLPAEIHYARHDGEGPAQMRRFFRVEPGPRSARAGVRYPHGSRPDAPTPADPDPDPDRRHSGIIGWG
ncbi:MAG: hypothetical protein ACRC33_12620 [Gemmataceae bacterium]